MVQALWGAHRNLGMKTIVFLGEKLNSSSFGHYGLVLMQSWEVYLHPFMNYPSVQLTCKSYFGYDRLQCSSSIFCLVSLQEVIISTAGKAKRLEFHSWVIPWSCIHAHHCYFQFTGINRVANSSRADMRVLNHLWYGGSAFLEKVGTSGCK